MFSVQAWVVSNAKELPEQVRNQIIRLEKMGNGKVPLKATEHQLKHSCSRGYEVGLLEEPCYQ